MPWAPFVVLAGAAYLPGLWPQTVGSLWGLVALAWCTWVFQTRSKGHSPAFVLPFLALALWAAAGFFWSQNAGATLHALLYFGLAAVIHRTAQHPGAVEPHRLFTFLTLLGAVRTAELLIYGALKRAGLDIVFWGSPNINFAGLTAALGAVAAVHVAPGPSRARRAAWVLPAVTGVVLFGNNSMGPLFAMLTGIYVWAAVDRQKPKALWATPVLAALLLGLFTFGPMPFLNNPNDPARWERLTIWKDTLRMILAHPWGAGLGTFESFVREFQNLPGARVAPHAHNEFLELFFELGLPGGGMAIGLILVTLAQEARTAFDNSHRRSGERVEPGVRLGLLAALLAAALVDFTMRAMFPLLLGALVLALGRSAPLSPQKRGASLLWVATAFFIAGHAAVMGLGLFHRIGKTHVKAGDFAQALPWFERATRLWPWEAHLYYDQADCLVRLKRPDEAVARLELSLRHAPRDIYNRRALAKLILAREGPEAAARVYAPILRLAPTHAPYWREMADLLLWGGDAAQSERLRARAQELTART